MTVGIWPTAVPLSLYAEIVGIPDLHWWGVRRGAHVDPNYFFFGSEDRAKVRRALDSATALMESRMRVRLFPAWMDGQEIPYGDKMKANRRSRYGTFVPRSWGNPAKLGWGRFIEAGQPALSIYSTVAPVTLGTPTCTCTIAHGGTGSRDEVRVYWTDTDYSFDAMGNYANGPEASKIEFGATNIVLTFPRERLVSPPLQSRFATTPFPVDYETDGNFVTTLTVARRYNDPSVNASVRITRACTTGCVTSTQTACVVPRNRNLGWIELHPAGYVDEAWCRSSYFLGIPEVAWIYYRSGLTQVPYELQDAIIRLGHTMIPTSPCGLEPDPVNRAWKRDQAQDRAITRERVNCPWGSKDGAWWAWNIAMASEYNYGSGGLHT